MNDDKKQERLALAYAAVIGGMTMIIGLILGHILL